MKIHFLLSVLLPSFMDAFPTSEEVCTNFTCDDIGGIACTDKGHTIELIEFDDGTSSTSGYATFVYEICSPPSGFCTIDSVLTTTACIDRSICLGACNLRSGKCQGGLYSGTLCTTDDQCNVGVIDCSRECSVDKFNALSHFDIFYPMKGSTCVSDTTDVTVECTAGVAAYSDPPCAGDSTGTILVKCNEPNIAVGQCFTMTVRFAGENIQVGSGLAVVGDKSGNDCALECVAGPSCESCETEPPGPSSKCITRTLGFWGTHPWITNDYTVSVCGFDLGCYGTPGATEYPPSDPICETNHCNDVMEGLGSIGGECQSIRNVRNCQSYVAMVKQLTAAKLNLAATEALFEEENVCGDYEYAGYSIHYWVDRCDQACIVKTAAEYNACISALDDFNQDKDFCGDNNMACPLPFSSPAIDDNGEVSGADPSAFTAAQNTNLVIGIGKCA